MQELGPYTAICYSYCYTHTDGGWLGVNHVYKAAAMVAAVAEGAIEMRKYVRTSIGRACMHSATVAISL